VEKDAKDAKVEKVEKDEKGTGAAAAGKDESTGRARQ
jgi:hypothetical protein